MLWGISLQKISMLNLFVSHSQLIKIIIYLHFFIFVVYDIVQHNARDVEVRD